MARKSNYISILQFDERRIGLLRVQKTGKKIDITASAGETGEWSAPDGSLSDALRAFAKQHGILHDTICSILPRHEMTTRILVLPSQDKDELAGMVRLGAEEYVPYPLHDLVVDQCIIDKLPDGQARVLAVYAHRDVVESHVRVLRDAGLEPERICVSSACMASAVVASSGASEERFAVVNLGSAGLEVLGLTGHRLEFDRGVGTVQAWERLGSAATDGLGSEALEELLVETRTSLSTYRRESEDGRGVDGIFLCSDWADVEPACAAVHDATQYECLPADFAKSLVGKGAGALSGLPVVSLGAALTVLGRAAFDISLVPASVVAERRTKSARQAAQQALALTAAILIALGGWFALANYQRTAYINRLQNRISAIEPLADEVAQKKRRLMRLQEHVDRSGTVVELLARVCEVMPGSGMNIMQFSFQHGQGITFEGRAEYRDYVFSLADALRDAGREEVPYFARAHEGPSKSEKERNQDVIRYSIIIPFPEPEGDESVEEGEE